MAKEIADEYASSLSDLTVNSKPLINMLTILAEENIEHAGVIVDTVEKHLEKVPAEIKLPVLYLVDSIIKNVGGAYTQKFSQSIVNMFTKTFKQVDEKIRAQMFKLRETWHDVFPATKLYQLDVKVNLIDPAWPIQAQPQPTQSNIHVNPNFLKKPSSTPTEEEENMRIMLAKKEHELLMLQKKKIELELEQTRRQLEMFEKSTKRMVSGKKEQEQLVQHRNKMELDLENTQRKIDNIEISTHRKKPAAVSSTLPMSLPSSPVPAIVNPVVAPVMTLSPDLSQSAKQRLGPPVSRSSGGARIAPVSRALAGARRDPRLARRAPAAAGPTTPVSSVPVIPHPALLQQPPIAPNVFDIKPLERVTKRKNVITIDVDERLQRQERPVRDPRLEKRIDSKKERKDRDERANDVKDRDDRASLKKDCDDRLIEKKDRDERSIAKKDRDERNILKKDRDERSKKQEAEDKKEETVENNSKFNAYLGQIADAHKVNKLPPIPKLNREDKSKTPASKLKKANEPRIEKKKKSERDSSKDSTSSSSPEKKSKTNSKEKKQKPKPETMEVEEEPVIAFKELKNYHKERYMRRNKEKSESPEKIIEEPRMEVPIIAESEQTNLPEIVTETGDVDLRVLPIVTEVKAATIGQKRPSTETLEGKVKKSKIDKFDILFGCEDVDLRTFGRGEDVDLRTLPQLEELSAPPPPTISEPFAPKVDSPKASPIRTPESPKPLTMMETIDSPEMETIDSPESSKIEEEPTLKPEENHTQDNDVEMKEDESNEKEEESPILSPRKEKDWNEVKKNEEGKKVPSKLDLVRAKLAEATKGKDRLGRPLLFTKSPSEEKERRRTISSSDDTDMRAENPEEFDAEDHKKTINIIMSQAKEQFNDGQIDKNQYQTLMYQVLQINEKLKLKEAKQRESLELSKRKLKATIKDSKVLVSKGSPKSLNNFGDIDERIPPPGMGMPPVFIDTPPDSQGMMDADMRRIPIPMKGGPQGPMVGSQGTMMDPQAPMMDPAPRTLLDGPPRPMTDGPSRPMMPILTGMPQAMFMRMQNSNMPMWRGPVPRLEEPLSRGPTGPSSRLKGPMPPFMRGPRFDSRGPRPPIDMPPPLPLPVPKLGVVQGPCPCPRYERCESPPPLGAPGFIIPPTDFKVLEYIEQDPVKSIMIDGINREIRYYGETAVIMMDWDDPKELKFLPGSRRVTFDNKDSVVLSFNEDYREVEIDDQVFNIRLGAPTRELYINKGWYECFFGGSPFGAIIDGKPRLIQLEGPLPQVDIGKDKRTDLVLGKINLIVDATHMCPVFLDAKVQKCIAGDKLFTIRFVDALRTVLINEQPFQVEFGGLPKPINLGADKHFIRFSVLPRGVKPGFVQIKGMEGSPVVPVIKNPPAFLENKVQPMEVNNVDPAPAPVPRTPSPEMENQGLDMLASLMTPTNIAPSTGSEYLSSENLFSKPNAIPGLDTSSSDEKEKPAPPAPLPILGLNVNDLFAKLVATGIVQVPKEETKAEEAKKVEEKPKPKEDRNIIHKVDLLRPETLRVKQPGIVAKLYGGMQCSGCGTRFPPEHTVRYSQHLDWHFRQNRRERDSARRAHSRHWHYDLSDWVQYEEVEDLEEREKSWFETTGAEGEVENPVEIPEETPSVPAGAPIGQHCALCGDLFDQFYNEDKEEWHLRNSVRHEDKNYHPQCYEDYKASLAKVESPKKEVPQEQEEQSEVKEDDTIEIVEADDTTTQSDDDESIVEVVETEEDAIELPVEIDEEGDEDDVIYKAEPVEQVDVDDGDTDDETQEQRAKRDKEFDFSKVKVKQEPVDPDDEPVITAEEEAIRANADTTQTTVLSSIDGNVQLTTAPVHTDAPVGIRINISKSIPSFMAPQDEKEKEKSLEDISADDEPLPPGEEPELEYKLKPNLEAVEFSRQPPVRKGTELSGLCSIM